MLPKYEAETPLCSLKANGRLMFLTLCISTLHKTLQCVCFSFVYERPNIEVNVCLRVVV